MGGIAIDADTLIPYYYQLCHLFLFIDDGDCASYPCMNGANCTDGNNTYSCQCLPGFVGVKCETGKMYIYYTISILKNVFFSLSVVNKLFPHIPTCTISEK